MAISSATSKAGPYAGNAVTTVFAFSFYTLAAADVKVISTALVSGVSSDTVLTQDVDYTVSLNADQVASPGGSVTMAVAPAVGISITVLRNITVVQTASFPNQGGFYPKVLENALDKLTMVVQQMYEELSRSIKFSVGAVTVTVADIAAQASSAASSAAAALASALSAAGSASSAAASAAAAAASSPLPTQIIDGLTRYLKSLDGAASWASIPAIQIVRVPRTSNTILDATNNQNLIDVTSGTFTQTFTAAATLGSGWYCWYRNSGTGDITIPSSDGVTNWIMYPGESRLFQCDGAGFNSVVITPFSKTITASANFIKPPGYLRYDGLAWGGGTSGAKGDGATQGGGGSGVAGTPFSLPAAFVGASETITIGAGGASVTAANTKGNDGGNTTIGTLVTALGATASATVALGSSGSGVIAGLGASNGFSGGTGGNGADGGSSIYGGGGGGGGSADVQRNGGASMWGGGGGGNAPATATPGTGGTSKFGGNGGAGSIAGNGTDGTAPGGGGGATKTGTQSGAGARGEVRIWGIA